MGSFEIARSFESAGVLVSRVAFVLAAVLVLGGCAKSCKDDHPYVPYSVNDAPSGSAAAAEKPPEEDAGTKSAEPSLVAGARTTTWKLEGLELVAPAGKEFALAIVRDVDDDGKKDALAVVRRAAPATGAAELLFYRGSSAGTPVSLATSPVTRIEPGCTPVLRLERVGPRSAFAELGASCPRAAASRGVFVVRLAKEPAITFDVIVRDPAGAPSLALDVDGADRDKDGIDDIALRVAIEGGGPPFEPGPRLSAKVAYFDRPAGPSRDPDEPEASFRAIAAQAAAKAKTKDAASVPVLVQQMRALFRAMCLEGGAPRLVKARGAVGAISCGNSKPLEDAGVAEVRAFVTQGDALRAVTAADVAQAAPATKTAAKTTEITTLLNQVAPGVQAKSSRTLVASIPVVRTPHPAWGAVAFEHGNKLLVRTGTKVIRFEPESGEESDSEVTPWPSQVLSPDGKSRWLEAYNACEGVALRATFAPTGGEGDIKDVLLPVAPALGTRCSGSRGEAAPAVPLAWSARGLETLVAGQPLLVRPESSQASLLASFLDEPGAQGSPRSPSGKAMALATRDGVLVRGAKWSRVRAPDLEPYDDLRACTISDDASMIACEKRGKVVFAAF
ncbi:hypothetical protein AKJ09_07842 [Labilithrix luteola]|uniref:Uncharacterized protein n=1 Tax=Labilithrix luteola TaxID=1391654 RepID=A0A0K1Q628_9BACT|nr:hypothetical protein [Labilithrix luteola]AKV01179.1 hypothetical protein AKJ09_07842 [Labilithrix luteola]